MDFSRLADDTHTASLVVGGIFRRVAVKLHRSLFATLLQDDSGQDLIEYALIAALLGLGAVASFRGLTRQHFNPVFEDWDDFHERPVAD